MMPWVLSATSVMYNLPGVKNNLHLSGKVIADIYLGKITKWNDARIAKLNKGVSLPGHDHHARLPQRRLGHDVQLHRVPERRERGLAEHRRLQHQRQLAEGRRRPW